MEDFVEEGTANMADKKHQKQIEQVETQVPCVVQMVGVEIRSTLKR